MSAPAVVLGHGIGALGVLRALGRAGIATLHVGPPGDPAARSRWAEPLGDAPSSALTQHLDRAGIDRAVLFPATDAWALAAAERPELERDHRPAVVPPAEALRPLVDKAEFYSVLAALGVPHPRTVPVTGTADVHRFDEATLAGFFLKPVDSPAFVASFRRKAVWAADREAVGAVLASGQSVLLQEFIPSEPTDHVFLDGYVDRSGRPVVCYARRRLRMRPAHFGSSTLTEVIDLGEVAGAQRSLERLLEGIGFRGGFFDAKFVHDARDDEFKLLEVIGRAWGQIALAAAVGADVCLLAYHDALGERIEPVELQPQGQRWVNSLADVAAWAEAVRSRRPVAGGPPPLAWRGAVRALFARDDRGPGRAAVRERLRRRP